MATTCKKCGALVEGTFCEKCGTKVEAEQTVVAPVAPPTPAPVAPVMPAPSPVSQPMYPGMPQQPNMYPGVPQHSGGGFFGFGTLISEKAAAAIYIVISSIQALALLLVLITLISRLSDLSHYGGGGALFVFTDFVYQVSVLVALNFIIRVALELMTKISKKS